jgi:phage gp16-like protein
MTDALRRKIHVGCRELGIDQDARRDLQLVVTGKSSMSEMTEADLKTMVGELERRGFKPSIKVRSNRRHKPAPRADLRFIHVLWRLLGDAGKLKQPDRRGLNTFIRRRFGETWGAVPRDIDDLRDSDKIETVIQALRKWCHREGVTINDKESGR